MGACERRVGWTAQIWASWLWPSSTRTSRRSAIRPVRLMPRIRSPLADRVPSDIDFIVVRENNVGEYLVIGGRSFEGTDAELVLQTSVFTRRGVDSIMHYAFERAQTLPTRSRHRRPGRGQPHRPDLVRAMMLEHLGHKDAVDAVLRAIETVPTQGPRTRDIGGQAGTQEVGRAMADAV